MKLAIISSCSLPIPAVSGGAVESLVESILWQNEVAQQAEITVFALHSEDAESESCKFSNTTFKYLKKGPIVACVDRGITKILRTFKKDIASRNYVWKLTALSKLREDLKKEDYDKVVLQNTIYLFDIFKDRNLFYKYTGKVYFHVHNSLVKRTTVDYKPLLKGIISISNFLHDNIREYFDQDIPIKTVYNGVDVNRFGKTLSENDRMSLREKYGIRREDSVIVFVGRIAPEKGIKEAILAFNRIQRNNVVFLIVGASYFGSGAESPFENDVLQLIDENDKIHITGFIDKNDIWKYYAISDVAVLPSMWDEPLGLTMIEAQVAGIPLITTISGGIPETVNSKYSILLNRDENIVDCLSNAFCDMLDNKESWKLKALQAQSYAKQKFNTPELYKKFLWAIQEEGRESRG